MTVPLAPGMDAHDTRRSPADAARSCHGLEPNLGRSVVPFPMLVRFSEQAVPSGWLLPFRSLTHRGGPR